MNFELYKIGSLSVMISYRSKPTKSDWPPEIDEDLSRLSNAWKAAPRTAKVDKENPLIRSSCVGFQFFFPFLSDDLGLESANRWQLPLYKGVLFPSQPKLACMGMQNFCCTLTLFEAQGWYIRYVILASRRPLGT
jgi:hypothetical protein